MLKISDDCVKVGMTTREFNRRYTDYPMVPILGVSYVDDTIAAEIILRLEMNKKFIRIRDSEHYECDPDIARKFFVQVSSKIISKSFVNDDPDKFKYFAAKFGMQVHCDNGISASSFIDFLKVNNVKEMYDYLKETDMVTIDDIKYIKPVGCLMLLAIYNKFDILREFFEFSFPINTLNINQENSKNTKNGKKKNKQKNNINQNNNINKIKDNINRNNNQNNNINKIKNCQDDNNDQKSVKKNDECSKFIKLFNNNIKKYSETKSLTNYIGTDTDDINNNKIMYDSHIDISSPNNLFVDSKNDALDKNESIIVHKIYSSDITDDNKDAVINKECNVFIEENILDFDSIEINPISYCTDNYVDELVDIFLEENIMYPGLVAINDAGDKIDVLTKRETSIIDLTRLIEKNIFEFSLNEIDETDEIGALIEEKILDFD